MSGIERANGHRPEGLVDALHPALEAAPRPDRDELSFDLDRAMGSVVRLHANIPPDAYTAAILGTEREGSGVVIDENGLVLTIGYLITEARTVTLTLGDGRTVTAEAIAYDHETGYGMVQSIETLDLPPLEFGDSNQVAEGDSVVVASFGGYTHSIAGRVMSIREFAGSWEYLLDTAFFTAPVHPYWGGAALIDAAGRLVGSGSLYIEETIAGEGRLPGNMFVPINLLKPIHQSMVSTGRSGRAPRPWLGMHTAEAGERLIVTGASPNGPADQGGIEPGDIVLSVDGVPVNGLAHMYRTIWEMGSAGSEVRFTVLRDDDVLNIRVRSSDRYSHLDLPRRH